MHFGGHDTEFALTTIGTSTVVAAEAYGNAYDTIFNRLQRDNRMSAAISELCAAGRRHENRWTSTLEPVREVVGSPP